MPINFNDIRELRPFHICPDGLRVSIQASRTHYCTPRNNDGPYTHVELGYPNQTPPDYILEYAENDKTPCQTVYSYVPIELVDKWLQEHGGLLNLKPTKQINLLK